MSERGFIMGSIIARDEDRAVRHNFAAIPEYQPLFALNTHSLYALLRFLELQLAFEMTNGLLDTFVFWCYSFHNLLSIWSLFSCLKLRRESHDRAFLALQHRSHVFEPLKKTSSKPFTLLAKVPSLPRLARCGSYSCGLCLRASLEHKQLSRPW